jgi:type II secretory pathway predicted ATPase ExeA
MMGPPGIGKTHLLQVLAARLTPRMRTLYLPYAALSLAELCKWSLGLLGERVHDYAAGALREYARHPPEGDGPLVLLVDEANSMPVETARDLGALLTACDGSLRVVLVASVDARTRRVIAALGIDELLQCFYAGPLSHADTRAYIEARLDMAHAPGTVRDRFDAEAVGQIHAISGGIPRRIHQLADDVMHGKPISAEGDSGDWLDATATENRSLDSLDDLRLAAEAKQVGSFDEEGGDGSPLLRSPRRA